jgi:hypothetical protein
MITNLCCNKCKKSFSRKYELNRHLNRITDCVTGSKTNKKNIEYKCKDCKKKFTRNDSLIRHKKICKNKKININTQNSKNVNINNGDNNSAFIKSPISINLVVFTKDGINNLTYNEIKALFKDKGNLVEKLIKIVNLNPNKPQHHNIFFNDLKSTYGESYQVNNLKPHKKSWISNKIDELIHLLIDAKLEDLNDILNDMNDFLNEKAKDEIRNTIIKLDYSKPNVRKKLISYLKPILYNHRDMIIKTRKLTKQQEQKLIKQQQEEVEREIKLSESSNIKFANSN